MLDVATSLSGSIGFAYYKRFDSKSSKDINEKKNVLTFLGVDFDSAFSCEEYSDLVIVTDNNRSGGEDKYIIVNQN